MNHFCTTLRAVLTPTNQKMVHVQDRSKVFKDAFKKMINETLRDRERISRLIAEKEGVNSSCMFSEIRIEEMADKENKEIEKGRIAENDQNKRSEEKLKNGEKKNLEGKENNKNGEDEDEAEENNKNGEEENNKNGGEENNKNGEGENEENTKTKENVKSEENTKTKEKEENTKIKEKEENTNDNNNKQHVPVSLNNAADLITILKHNLSQSFKTLLIQSSIAPSLSNLSELINQNIINRRDIKNKDYVREVFGSYGAQHKRVLVSTLSAMTEDMRHRVQRMKERVNAVGEQMGRVDEQRTRIGERYVEMYKRFGDVLH